MAITNLQKYELGENINFRKATSIAAGGYALSLVDNVMQQDPETYVPTSGERYALDNRMLIGQVNSGLMKAIAHNIAQYALFLPEALGADIEYEQVLAMVDGGTIDPVLDTIVQEYWDGFALLAYELSQP